MYDTAFEAGLLGVPEWRAMRALSPAYHVVEATGTDEGTELLCRDLRTRNFGGRFGTLRVRVGRDGTAQVRSFDV